MAKTIIADMIQKGGVSKLTSASVSSSRTQGDHNEELSSTVTNQSVTVEADDSTVDL